MSWNKWVRQIHRWLTVALTLAMIVNVAAIVMKKYTATIGLMAVVPFAFCFLPRLFISVALCGEVGQAALLL